MARNGIAVAPDGVRIRFESHGSGTRALVFVHGWSCDRSYWNAQIRALAGRYRVVAVDLAGHGESGLGRSAWTMPAFGDDVVAVVHQLDLREVVLVGHSMGGDVIVEAALPLADRVAGLVWVDTYRKLPDPMRPAEIETFLEPFRLDFAGATASFVQSLFLPTSDPALVDWIAADMAAAPPDVAIAALAHSLANEGPIVARMHELAAPLVAINPDYRPTDVDSLQRHGVRAVIMSGVGHFAMMEDPGQFDRVLEEVLQRF